MDLFFLRALIRGKLQTTANFEEELNQIPLRVKRYREIEKSAERKEYLELEKKVNAPDFQVKKKEIVSTQLKRTTEYALSEEFKKICKRKEVRAYLRENQGEDNPVVQRYLELKKQVESPEFEAQMAFWQNKKRWETTEEGKLEARYEQLKKSDDRVFFDSVDAKQVEHWEQFSKVYEDEFDWLSLKESSWKPGFIYPDGFKNVHSYSNEKQAYVGGKNIVMRDSSLRIKTRRENVEGAAWDVKKGMFIKPFTYSSDCLYTDKVAIEEGSVVQCKCKCRGRLNHGVYLRSKSHVPFISVFDYTGLKLYCGVKDSLKHDKNLKLLDGLQPIPYTIFTVSWQHDEIVWFVNNMEVYRTKNLVPKGEKLYLHLYSFAFANDKFTTEGELDVDWIRVYKLNK